MYRNRFLRTRVVFKMYVNIQVWDYCKRISEIHRQAISIEIQCILAGLYTKDHFYLLILLRTQFTGTFELTMHKQWSILIISMWKYFYNDWNIYVRYNVTHFQIMKFMNRKLIWISYKACNNPIIQCYLHTHFTFCTILINCSIFLKLGKKSMIF